jgi:hypothetical protein
MDYFRMTYELRDNIKLMNTPRVRDLITFTILK